MLAGVLAGGLGALLGIGGGVFLVPFLNSVVGLPMKIAIATSLMTVIATSSAVSAGTAGRNLINLRLGMLLEVASAAGGLAAGLTFQHLSERTLYVAFAIVTALIAVLMLTRLDRRNVLDVRSSPGRSAAVSSTRRAAARLSTGSSGCRSRSSCRPWPASSRARSASAAAS